MYVERLLVLCNIYIYFIEFAFTIFRLRSFSFLFPFVRCAYDFDLISVGLQTSIVIHNLEESTQSDSIFFLNENAVLCGFQLFWYNWNHAFATDNKLKAKSLLWHGNWGAIGSYKNCESRTFDELREHQWNVPGSRVAYYICNKGMASQCYLLIVFHHLHAQINIFRQW